MIGIIGGTGLYSLDGIKDISSKQVDTPFGPPSSAIVTGNLHGRKIAFLPRHGKDHQILPSEINFRANIWAMKSVGVRRLISVSAVGSLRKEISPGDLAIPNQYFDWTKGNRKSTFFGNGVVAHISTANPSCPQLTSLIKDSANLLGFKAHSDKTYACVEGPRLGTRAESLFLQNTGCDLVGMTNVPEAFLAREAQICYCTVAVATDYDCWLDDPSQHASVDKVIELYKKNIGRVKDIIGSLVKGHEENHFCECRHSLQYAVMTPENNLSKEQRELLEFLRS